MPLFALARKLIARTETAQSARRMKAVIALVLAFLALSPILGLLAVIVFAEDDSAFGAAPVQVNGVSDTMLSAYTQAVKLTASSRPQCHSLTWSMLAGIAQVESTQADGHQISPAGQVTPPIYGPLLDGSTPGTEVVKDTDQGALDGDAHYDRAVGPFQILPSTWTPTAVDAVGDGRPDPQNAYDAAATAAVLLCGTSPVDLSDRRQLSDRILTYNHSQTYVTQVLAWIDSYDGIPSTGTTAGSATGGAVLAAAQAEIGTPYAWGGGGTAGPSLGFCDGVPGNGDGWAADGSCSASVTTGFDCSGLAQFAAAKAGKAIPRGATDQMNSGLPVISAKLGIAALQPGDLVFFANAANPAYMYHVGIYAGGGNMVDCPHTGTFCRTEPVWLDDYAGAVRP